MTVLIYYLFFKLWRVCISRSTSRKLLITISAFPPLSTWIKSSVFANMISFTIQTISHLLYEKLNYSFNIFFAKKLNSKKLLAIVLLLSINDILNFTYEFMSTMKRSHMKIAVVWKWWSGKTTLSRLLTHSIAQHTSVVGIDSDHNMDYIDLMWLEFNEQTPTFKKNYDTIFTHLEWKETEKNASKTIAKNLGTKKFSLHPQDKFSKQILIPHTDNIHLAVVGLGSNDVISAWMCSHNISNPLKIYLALLDEGASDIVIDWVAWVDMVNFGLYHTCDFLLIAVEPSRNGVKVAKQIQTVCEASHLNYWFVINKYQENEYVNDLLNREWRN